MSLWDIDKNHEKRLNPTPNQSDQVMQRMAHNTSSTTYRKDDSSNKQRVAFKNSLILYYDDQGRVIRVDGFIPALAVYPVTIIAKYGYDVYTDILGLTAPTV